MSTPRTPQKLLPWFEARKRYRLSHAQVQMARELGLNPNKFGGLANHRQQPWKVPLPLYIEKIYFKHFGVERPAEVMSLEEVVSRHHDKKDRKREAKRLKINAPQGASDASTVADGKVVVGGDPLAEGSVVTILAREADATFEVPPELEAEFLASIAQADRGETISVDELIERLRPIA